MKNFKPLGRPLGGPPPRSPNPIRTRGGPQAGRMPTSKWLSSPSPMVGKVKTIASHGCQNFPRRRASPKTREMNLTARLATRVDERGGHSSTISGHANISRRRLTNWPAGTHRSYQVNVAIAPGPVNRQTMIIASAIEGNGAEIYRREPSSKVRWGGGAPTVKFE